MGWISTYHQFECTVHMRDHVVVKVAVSCYTIQNFLFLSSGKKHDQCVQLYSDYDDVATGELYVYLPRLSYWGIFSFVNLK